MCVQVVDDWNGILEGSPRGYHILILDDVPDSSRFHTDITGTEASSSYKISHIKHDHQIEACDMACGCCHFRSVKSNIIIGRNAK